MTYIAIVFFTLLAGGGMAATNCGSILSKLVFFHYAHQVLHAVFDRSKCQAKSIKFGMDLLGTLFTQEAKANMFSICPLQSVVLR